MIKDDMDWGVFTGGLGDLNDDGIVDFVEFLNEEAVFQEAMDYYYGDDEDEDEDEDEDYYYDDEYSSYEECTASDNKYRDEEYPDFNTSKLSFAIDVINQIFGVDEKNKSNAIIENTTINYQSPPNIQKKYYDHKDRKYRIGDAIHDNFKEIRDNYAKHECKHFSSLINQIYRVDKKLAVTIWVWAIYNFPGALVNNGVDECDSQAWSLTDCLFSDFATIDNESDNEEESTLIFRYVSKNPDLEEIIFNKTYVEDNLFSINKYIPFCVKNNLRENFLRVYNGIMTNRFRDEKKLSKYSILEDLLDFCEFNGVEEADPWFYSFFEKEIKALNKPLKEACLMEKLNKENYDIRVFLKPGEEKTNLDDDSDDESYLSSELYADDLELLQDENIRLKSKIAQLEKAITDLNCSIQRLEANLTAKQEVKEWDGKYYRYCKVTLNEYPNGLWYRTDDMAIKKGDYVYVPLGFKNEERQAEVISVEDFRSDNLPFPLERTKFISKKCDV